MTNTRIRWDDEPEGDAPCYAGRAEKADACTRSDPESPLHEAWIADADLFIIWPPDERDSQWLLTSQLPGQDVAIYGDGLEELQGRAEELLAEFAASLGEAMQEPKPFSAQFDRLYGEYLGAGTPVSWEQWLARYEAASRTLAEATETAADCGGEHHVPAE